MKSEEPRGSRKDGGRMIRLQRIYNFLLFHAIILSVLDVFYALLCYFILFLGLTY